MEKVERSSSRFHTSFFLVTSKKGYEGIFLMDDFGNLVKLSPSGFVYLNNHYLD